MKQAKIEALKSIAKSLLGIDLLKVKIVKEKERGKELTSEEEIELFENEMKRMRETPGSQIMVREEELRRYLAEG